LAALQNPKRVIKRGFVSESVASWLAQIHAVSDRAAIVRQVESNEIGRFLHEGAVHQGIALEVEELPRTRLGDACALDGSNRPVVVLDQITDPHNIGAVIRSAVAFGARAVIVQDRRTPPLAGALAKAAAGAVELLPCVEVVNVARSLEGLKALGYHCAGLTGDAPSDLSELPTGRPIALVLGSEGEGLRQLVASTCDALYRIPVDRRIESLNVSNAAAIALYEAKRRSES
jgi:23S rRNA (guanosine2251-2'-O)-methyltransferase